jgi:ribosomal-protein-alanine N-acetyltransferase
LTIRPGNATDLDAVAAIQAQAPEASNWPPSDYLDQIFLVACDPNKTIAGFAAARRVAEGEFELLNLAVSPVHRRAGYGERLLRFIIESYPGVWFLEVRAGNQAAQELYRKLGFQAAGRRKNYYPIDGDENREEGIVFRFRPC